MENLPRSTKTTRASLIAEGALIDITAAPLGYLVKEAGFSVPIAFSRAAFSAAIWPIWTTGAEIWPHGRSLDPLRHLWDALTILNYTIKAISGDDAIGGAPFTVMRSHGRVFLSCFLEAGDDGKLAITIKLREEGGAK